LDAEEKDAADILGGNATGDKGRADAGRDRHAKTDKRAESRPMAAIISRQASA
jgi:hypothetical protein